MGLILVRGMESRDILRDGFSITSGTPSYPSDVPVGGSTRSLTNGSVVSLLALTAPFTTPVSEFWIIVRIKPRANNSANDLQRIGWRAGGVTQGEITYQDNTLNPQIYVSGLQDTATQPLNFNVWNQLHIHVNIHTVTGFVRIYANGDIQPGNHVAEFLGNTDPAVDVTMNELYIALNGGGGAVPYIDDLIVMDPNDATGIVDINELASPAVFPAYPTSDGFHTALTKQGTPGGAGDFEHIDEVQPDDGDYVRATAAAQKSTYGFTTAPTTGKVIAARVKARVLRGDATAGVNIRTISRQSAVDYVGATQAAPADGDVDEIYDLAPDGTAWDTSKFDAVEFGVESVT